MKYEEVQLGLKRLPQNKTLMEVWIGGNLWKSRIVPFDSLVGETWKIDRELSNKFDFFSPFLPDVRRLVNAVRAIGVGHQSILARRPEKKPEPASDETVLDGHRVCEVIWETEAAVVFRDEAGRIWRWLRSYNKSWSMTFED